MTPQAKACGVFFHDPRISGSAGAGQSDQSLDVPRFSQTHDTAYTYSTAHTPSVAFIAAPEPSKSTLCKIETQRIHIPLKY
ncbi:MAG: hypothetical protein MK095_10125, partial [Phycisphaerales bacterium]|nr:hypothetical protein [Phycisphaerales bacterium]